MKLKNLWHGGIFILMVAFLLAACAPAQSLAQTTSSSTAPVASATSASTSTAQATTATTAATAPASASGTRYVLVPANSSASYSVREQLAQLKLPTDAVGKTNSVSGQLVVNSDGSIDTKNSQFVVDVSTLKTDSTMRDGYVANNILQSNQYPNAIFVPTQLSGLPSPLPQSGNLSFTVTGNLTIRNVTKPVTWTVTGSIANGEATGTATTSFTFEDFGLNQPQVPVVLSVVDKITLTVTFDLQPSTN